MTPREQVLERYPDAYASSWKNSMFIAQPRERGGIHRLSSLQGTEDLAWEEAAERLAKATAERGPYASIEAPDEVPTVQVVLQYTGKRQSGTSYAIENGRELVTYALPFVFPPAGTKHLVTPSEVKPTSMQPMNAIEIVGGAAVVGAAPTTPDPVAIVAEAKMAPTFACPLCRMAADFGKTTERIVIARENVRPSDRIINDNYAAPDCVEVERQTTDTMAAIIAGSVDWAWSYIDDETPRKNMTTTEMEHAANTFAVAVGKAIDHLKRHGIAADWHTVDVLDVFYGTAHGAVVFRGLGPIVGDIHAKRITATGMYLRMNQDGTPAEAIFVADRVPGVRGKAALLVDLEPTSSSVTDLMRFDGPITMDGIAVAPRQDLREEIEVLREFVEWGAGAAGGKVKIPDTFVTDSARRRILGALFSAYAMTKLPGESK